MNVRVIGNDAPDAGPDQAGSDLAGPDRAGPDRAGPTKAAARARTTAATPRPVPVPVPANAPDPSDPADRDEPVSVGDRLRRMLTSGGQPMYPRVLRLKHVHPNGWQRACLVEGMALVGTLAALADLATAWAPLVLPVGAAVVVKFHDVLAGLLPATPRSGNDSAASPTEGNAAGNDGRAT